MNGRRRKYFSVEVMFYNYSVTTYRLPMLFKYVILSILKSNAILKSAILSIVKNNWNGNFSELLSNCSH